MYLATAIVTVLLAALLIFAALRKLTHAVDVVQSYLRAGVPEDKLKYLAALLLSAAVALILGLWWAPLGIAAAIGLVGYFAVAIAFHVRAGDSANLPTPITMAGLSVLALVLRILAASTP